VSGLLPALGGGANSVVQLAAGGLRGVLAMSALIATGVVAAGPPAAGQASLALVGCPGSGSVVAVARPGDQMLVTGRSADGAWFRVYVPGPAEHDGWVPASTINLLADGSAVPIAGCAEVAAATGTPGPTAVPASATPTATATVVPIATPTATARPTPTPTAVPTASPTPTPTPNLGPRFTTQPYSDVAIVNTNPLGTGSCAYALGTGLTTKVSDTDGVSAIQLWVRKPGAASYKRFSHDFTNNGATWNNFINAKDDGVTTAGTLSWYALAVDRKGAQTKSKVRTLKIVRCDTEAEIGGGITTPFTFYAGSYVATYEYGSQYYVPWSFAIADGDGLSKATLTYTLRDPAGVTIRAGSIALAKNGSTWYGRSQTFDANTNAYKINTATWRLVTTDPFGGTTSYPPAGSQTDSWVIRLP
jgi:hypothetical protein